MQGSDLVGAERALVAEVEGPAQPAVQVWLQLERQQLRFLEQPQDAVIEGEFAAPFLKGGGGGAGGVVVVERGPTEATGGADVARAEIALSVDAGAEPRGGDAVRCDEPVEAGALALAEVPLTDADAGATNKVRGPVCDLDEAAGASAVGLTEGVVGVVGRGERRGEAGGGEGVDEVADEGRGFAWARLAATEQFSQHRPRLPAGTCGPADRIASRE